MKNAYFCATMRKKFVLICILALGFTLCKAEVRLTQIFQSGMVLQRGTIIPVWGTANPHEIITISLNRKTFKTIADTNGHWRVDIPSMKAGGPYELVVRGEASETKLTDVWLGDVWLCSGQSNTETTLERVSPQYPDELNDSNSMVRLFHVPYQTNTHKPSADLRPASWQPLNRENSWRFSAIGYFMGKQLQREKGVAQGIIESAWGGTPIEAWIAADTLALHYPTLYRKTQLYQDDAYVESQQRATNLANQRWREILDASDPGVGLYTNLDYDDSQWDEANQFDLKLKQGYIGSIWLRQHINISKEHAGRPAKLLLGTLYDSDVTYINGTQVGTTGYQYPPRRYEVPEGLLREGDNVITVRFINMSGTPYFGKEKPYQLVFGKDDIQPLDQQWKIQAGVEMPPIISQPITLNTQPSTLFNGMISPLAPFAVAGVVWYQGETNADFMEQANEYASMLRLLIANWRQAFQRPQMPFVIVQLANFMEPSEQPQHTGWSVIREAQRVVAKEDEHAALAVTIDLGEKVDIHPLRKKEVASRIAAAFEHLLWKPRTELSTEIISTTVDSGSVVCTLSQSLLNDGALYEFEVAGADGQYVNAEAQGSGSRITIKSPVAHPASVRYAWKNNPQRANVYGKNGLPMSPCQIVLSSTPTTKK